MKPFTGFFMLLCLTSAAPYAFADEYGRVLSTTPIVRDMPQSRQVCRDETVNVPAQRSGVGALIGGVAGGLLGNTVGRGAGNTVATAAGAFTGAIVGDRLGNDGNGTSTRQERRCQTVSERQEQVVGYGVVYEYAGKQYKTRVAQDPGQWIPVTVQANTAAYPEDDTYRQPYINESRTVVETVTPVAVYSPAPYYAPVVNDPSIAFRYDAYPHRHYRHWD